MTKVTRFIITILLSLIVAHQNLLADEHDDDKITDSALEAIEALGGTIEENVDEAIEEETFPASDTADMENTVDAETTDVSPDAGMIPLVEEDAVTPEPETVSVQEAALPPSPPSKDVYLVLDNSGSMKKNDPQFLASQAVNEFINRLDEDSRVAIVIFDQNVKIPVPLTEVNEVNKQSILSSLEQINYQGQFTDSPAAIERAIYNLKSNAREDAKKLIVFMTDGIVDTGNADQDLEKSRWLKQDLAADAADSEIQIFGIAFTEDADFQLIQSLAQKTDGEYYRALLPEDLTNVFEQISEIINKVPEPEPVIVEQPVSVPEPAPVIAQPPPQPVIIEVPVQQKGLGDEEELRSRMILIALAVLIVAVLIMVLMLIRGGGKKRADDVEAQEAYLNDIHGYTNQSSFKLGNKPSMLGRVAGTDKEHLNYIVIPETTIGRRHSLIEYKDFAYWIIDQGSINGTFVNDQMISSETRLKHGDKVRLHKFEFEFSMPEMDDAGMTVISNTVIAANPSMQKNEDEDATVARGSEPADDSFDEPDFDLTGGADGFNDEEDTLMNESSAENEDTEATRDETLMLDDDISEIADDEDATIRPDMVDDEDPDK